MPGGTLSPGWPQAPPKEGHFCCSGCIFGSPRTEHFTCVLDRGKMLAAPPGTWSRPPGRAADGLPAALCSWKQSPKLAPAPCDTSEHRGVCTALAAITRARLSPSTRSAGLPPAPSAPLAGKNHLRGLLSRARRGCARGITMPHPSWGTRGPQTQPRGRGAQGQLAECAPALVPPWHQHQAKG